jgi:hypothetical protein
MKFKYLTFFCLIFITSCKNSIIESNKIFYISQIENSSNFSLSIPVPLAYKISLDSVKIKEDCIVYLGNINKENISETRISLDFKMDSKFCDSGIDLQFITDKNDFEIMRGFLSIKNSIPEKVKTVNSTLTIDNLSIVQNKFEEKNFFLATYKILNKNNFDLEIQMQKIENLSNFFTKIRVNCAQGDLLKEEPSFYICSKNLKKKGYLEIKILIDKTKIVREKKRLDFTFEPEIKFFKNKVYFGSLKLDRFNTSIYQ